MSLRKQAEKDEPYSIAVDFDGVIHSFTSPWGKPWDIPDGPVLGSMTWLHSMLQHFDVYIFSTRARGWRGRWAIKRWFKRHGREFWPDEHGTRGLNKLKITGTKPPCLIYLDDRAVRFEGPGTFPSRQEIHNARPWHKLRKKVRVLTKTTMRGMEAPHLPEAGHDD